MKTGVEMTYAVKVWAGNVKKGFQSIRDAFLRAKTSREDFAFRRLAREGMMRLAPVEASRVKIGNLQATKFVYGAESK